MSIKDGGFYIFSVYCELSLAMTSLKNVYMFRGTLHRPAETLALVIMSQPPAAYSDCLNIKIPEQPNLWCRSAKVLGGHTHAQFKKFKIRLITYGIFKYSIFNIQMHT